MAISPQTIQYPFLRNGNPFFDAADLNRCQSQLRHFSSWEAVVFVGRSWCTTLRKDKIRPPVALFVFGVAEDENTCNKDIDHNNKNNNNQKNDDVEDSTRKKTHSLIFSTVLEDAKPLTVTEELNLVLRNCPTFFRPPRLVISYFSQVQHTLDFIRKVKGSELCQQIATIVAKEKFTSTSYLLRQTIKKEKIEEVENDQLHQNKKGNEAEGDSTDSVLDISPFPDPQQITISVGSLQPEPEGAGEAATSLAALTKDTREHRELPLLPHSPLCVETFTTADGAVVKEREPSSSSASASASASPFGPSYSNSNGSISSSSDAANNNTCATNSPSSTCAYITAPPSFMDLVAQWAYKERDMFPNVSMQSFTESPSIYKQQQEQEGEKGGGNIDLLAVAAINEILLLSAKYPELSTMRIASSPSPSKTCKNKRESYNEAQEEKSMNQKHNDKMALICGTFTVPPAYLPSNKYPHVLFLQRPSVVPTPTTGENNKNFLPGGGGGGGDEVAMAAASEGVELGPTQPQPIGVELHLHGDPGDAAFVQSILSKPLNVQLYEDLLHPDGEVYVQVGPVEGAAVADAEAAIRAFSYAHHNNDNDNNNDSNENYNGQTEKNKKGAAAVAWGFPYSSSQPSSSSSPSSPPPTKGSSLPLRPVASGNTSQYYVPVPRVVYNAPTGKTERRTPLEKPKTLLASSQPNTEILMAAAAAMKYFVEVMIVSTAERNTAEEKDSSNDLPQGATTTRTTTDKSNNINNKGHYEIDWAKAVLDWSVPATAATATPEGGEKQRQQQEQQQIFTCNFCHRKRLKMMRCGACKVTSYCCRDHQQKDWVGQHKNECKLLKVAKEEYISTIEPLLKPHQNESQEVQQNTCEEGEEAGNNHPNSHESEFNNSLIMKSFNSLFSYPSLLDDNKSKKSEKKKNYEAASNVLTFLRLLELCHMSAYYETTTATATSGTIVGKIPFDLKLLEKIQFNTAARIAAEEAEKKGKGETTEAKKDVKNEENGEKNKLLVINVHLLNIGDVFAFMKQLANWWNTATKNKTNKNKIFNVQYRIILVNSSSINASEQNKVYAIKKKNNTTMGSSPSPSNNDDGTYVYEVAEVESTGILGDIWRSEGRKDDKNKKDDGNDDNNNNSGDDDDVAPFLFRLYSERYHNVAERLFSSVLLSPAAVVSVGPSTTEGQSFFNASTEVIADDVIARGVPFAFAEPHYVASYRTTSAINNRLKLSPTVAAEIAKKRCCSSSSSVKTAATTTATDNKYLVLLDDSLSHGLVNRAAVNTVGICPFTIAGADGGEDLSEDDDDDDDDNMVSEAEKEADRRATALAAQFTSSSDGASSAVADGVATSAVPLHLNAYISVMMPALQ